ncbi:MAG TPA: choice-of-anchor tandem repeat GloVer-containing protein, partial [Verrucomicrobiae bacterium]|nr:choice-of-anchor tandem repeat GloVer-containing protein [Verrucomicrobiae bacterium]
MNLDGSGYTNLHSFGQDYYTNIDGLQVGRVIVSSDTLYGVAAKGGWYNYGTLFKIKTDGTGFTVLRHFNNPDMLPQDGLVVSGNTLYGVVSSGGSNGYGAVFTIKTDGTAFSLLHSFKYNEGSGPLAGLTLAGDTLYGVTPYQGIGAGTVFKLRTDGSGFAVLHTINIPQGDAGGPCDLLCVSGNSVYGTSGSTTTTGAIFRVNIDGTGFTNLHYFYPAPGGTQTNVDGRVPRALTVVGQTLYGTAAGGGYYANGVLFKLNTDGSGFMPLYQFPDTPNTRATNFTGTTPAGPLTIVGNTLYATAANGGTNGRGSVLSFTLPAASPPLTFVCSRTALVLMWPTNSPGFSVQSAGDLASWTNVPIVPTVVNGNYVVTNPIPNAPRQFYRLKQ